MDQSRSEKRDDPTASIIVPAHNEESSLARLLDSLLADATAGEFEILILCNGCTDRTAEIARGYEPSVTVVELPRPSKREALKYGDDMMKMFPRVYIDSDVRIEAADVRALVRSLNGSVLVAAPSRVIPRTDMSLLVKAYYDLWESLPNVMSAPFGRGVVALSSEGHRRIESLPPLMADDLAMTSVFGIDERAVVSDAKVIVWPPRTLRDLVRRRTRVNTGNAEMDRVNRRSDELRTSPRTLIRVIREHPALIGKLPIFVVVTCITRFQARRRIRSGDFDTWLRDDSSRKI